MHLYKRGPVWWVRWARHGVEFRKSTRERDKRAAEIVKVRWQRELADPASAAANQATIESAAERFLEELRSEDVSPDTIEMYECKVGHVVRLMGDVRLADLTDNTKATAYTKTREAEGAARYTVHRDLTALRRILQSAAGAGEFRGNPKAVLPKSYSTGYEPRTRYLSCFELAAVMDHLAPGRAAWCAFSVATSARLGEIARARRSDITRDAILLRGTKTESSLRSIPIVSLFRPLIERVLRDADGVDGLLFAPWGNSRRDILRACERAGVDPFTTNDLRRTTATWLAQLDVPFEVIAKVTGHKSPAMLRKVYAQINAEDVGRLIEARLLQT